MKGECLKDKLRTGVALAEKITGKNVSLPVLGSILVEARGKSFVLKATNLDVGLEYDVPGKIEKEGVVAISGALLNNFLSATSAEETIKLESVNNNLSLATSRTSTLMKSLPAEEFPIIPRVEPDEKFVIPADVFASGVRAVWYAASLSDTKPEIASVFVTVTSDEITFVATDSFRLAEKKVPYKEAELDSSFLIPYKNATDLVRIFEHSHDPLTIEVNKNQIAVSQPGAYFTSRLVGGTFPNYRQIMPTSHKTEVIVEKKEFISSLKLSNIFADRLNQITLKIVAADNLFEVESKNQDMGENTTRLDAQVSGEDLAMSFNAKYILDCFATIAEERVSLAFNGPGRPLVVRGVGNGSFTYLVMPMNR